WSSDVCSSDLGRCCPGCSSSAACLGPGRSPTPASFDSPSTAPWSAVTISASCCSASTATDRRTSRGAGDQDTGHDDPGRTPSRPQRVRRRHEPPHPVRPASAGIARSEATPVQIIDLTDVPLEECIKRDQDRDSPIGEAVIRDLHRRFVAGQPYPLPVPEPADIGSGTGDLYIPPKYGEPAVIVSVMVLVGVLVHLHLLALVLPSDHAAAGIRYIGKAERIEKGPFPSGRGLFCVSRELCADRRRPGFMPTHERHSSNSTPVGVDPGGRVFDDVCGQAAEVEPAQ